MMAYSYSNSLESVCLKDINLTLIKQQNTHFCSILNVKCSEDLNQVVILHSKIVD